jgi:hypothetical protein
LLSAGQHAGIDVRFVAVSVQIEHRPFAPELECAG